VIDLVVLAAGRGRRLGSVGDATPKWLLEVDGQTIAERQLDAAQAQADDAPAVVDSIHAVVGHAADACRDFAADSPASIELIENPLYDELNNWYSLLLAIRALDRQRAEQRLVVFNGDLLARRAWFASFLDESAAHDGETLIAVDKERTLTEESMKVSARDDNHDLLERVGKREVDSPVGEYVGMFMVAGSARKSLREKLETYVDSDSAKGHWYEQAIGDTARDRLPWTIWATPDSDWIEIDDESDLMAARELDLR
jgi:choline kinase